MALEDMQNTVPPQHQNVQPGRTKFMDPQPQDQMTDYKSADRFIGKTAIVTGGDSGIGRAAAIGFAKEGAQVAVIYLEEQEDAAFTRACIEAEGVKALMIQADLNKKDQCIRAIQQVINSFGKVDVLCNNAAEQHPKENVEEITEEQLQQTFATNIFSMFYLVQAALPHMQGGSSIINIASVTAYAGSPHLVDYSASKGAIVSFTRSLSLNLAEKNIRVNAVAPGPIWTPLIPSTFRPDQVAAFGQNVPMKRPGQPDEVAPAILFLASNDATYISGQTFHVIGGKIVNG